MELIKGCTYNWRSPYIPSVRISTDGHRMESVSDTYETLDHNRNNQFLMSNQHLRHKRNNPGHQKQGRLWCNGFASVCLGVLCTLLLACTMTQHVMYTIAGKGQLESIQNLTLQREDLLKALSEVNQHIQMGWWYGNYSVYYISNEKIQWSQSRQYCKARNADLVIIDSIEEQRFIEKLTKTDAWIGLTNKDHTGVFKWVDGFPLNFGFWDQDHPMNLKYESCVKIKTTNPSIFTWQNIPCYCELNFICEKNIFR